MHAHIFAYFGPFDTRSHKVANLAYCTKCSILCYKVQRIHVIIGQNCGNGHGNLLRHARSGNTSKLSPEGKMLIQTRGENLTREESHRDSRLHKVANLTYCTKCSKFCYKEQRIRIDIRAETSIIFEYSNVLDGNERTNEHSLTFSSHARAHARTGIGKKNSGIFEYSIAINFCGAQILRLHECG